MSHDDGCGCTCGRGVDTRGARDICPGQGRAELWTNAHRTSAYAENVGLRDRRVAPFSGVSERPEAAMCAKSPPAPAHPDLPHRSDGPPLGARVPRGGGMTPMRRRPAPHRHSSTLAATMAKPPRTQRRPPPRAPRGRLRMGVSVPLCRSAASPARRHRVRRSVALTMRQAPKDDTSPRGVWPCVVTVPVHAAADSQCVSVLSVGK